MAAKDQAAALHRNARLGLGTGLPQTACTSLPGTALCDMHSLEPKHVTHTIDMPQLTGGCRDAWRLANLPKDTCCWTSGTLWTPEYRRTTPDMARISRPRAPCPCVADAPQLTV